MCDYDAIGVESIYRAVRYNSHWPGLLQYSGSLPWINVSIGLDEASRAGEEVPSGISLRAE